MRFFIECTQTHRTSFNSGIQRVVRSIVKAAVAGVGEDVAVPVIYEAGRFIRLTGSIPFPEMAVAAATPSLRLSASVMRLSKAAVQSVCAALVIALPFSGVRRFVYAPRNRFGLAGIVYSPKWLLARLRSRGAASVDTHTAVDMADGDVLLLLDSSWDINAWKAIDACKAHGVFVAVVLYDLIPLTHPQFCTPGVIEAYTSWLTRVLPRADLLVGISATTASEIRALLPGLLDIRQALPPVTHFWLGSELDGERAGVAAVDPALLSLCAAPGPTYLYVSTIEPRKNHRYALAAFDALWASGMRATFVMIGRVGWHSDDFVRQVLGHAQFGHQLFMFNEVDDTGLAYLYTNAQGLVFTSFAEGFGLPVIEGLQRGLPVFASDIPVFREIGQEGVRFVDLARPAALEAALREHVASGSPRLEAPVPWLTWAQSTQQLLARVGSHASGRDRVGGDQPMTDLPTHT